MRTLETVKDCRTPGLQLVAALQKPVCAALPGGVGMCEPSQTLATPLLRAAMEMTLRIQGEVVMSDPTQMLVVPQPRAAMEMTLRIQGEAGMSKPKPNAGHAAAGSVDGDEAALSGREWHV